MSWAAGRSAIPRAAGNNQTGTTIQGISCRRLLNLALLNSRMARLVEVNMGSAPRNVRSDGVAPCKWYRLPNTKKQPSMNNAPGMQYAIQELRSATIRLA